VEHQSASDSSVEIRRRVTGKELSSVTFVRDYVQIDFDGPKFNVLTPITVSSPGSVSVSGNQPFRNRLCDQIGKMVADLTLHEGQFLVLGFTDGSSITFSLRDEDYPGPEAIVFSDREHFWIL